MTYSHDEVMAKTWGGAGQAGPGGLAPGAEPAGDPAPVAAGSVGEQPCAVPERRVLEQADGYSESAPSPECAISLEKMAPAHRVETQGLRAQYAGYGMSFWDTLEEAEASFRQPRVMDGISRASLPAALYALRCAPGCHYFWAGEEVCCCGEMAR